MTNWDGGVRQPQHHAAARIHQAVARSGYRYFGAGLSGQERHMRANGSSVTFADGKKLFVGGSNPDVPETSKKSRRAP